ncbi:hypothetical protein Tco_0197458, partial [Tanacetum coccineum]
KESLSVSGVVSTFLFLVFEEVLRLLLVGSLSSLEADSDSGVIGLAIFRLGVNEDVFFRAPFFL